MLTIHILVKHNLAGDGGLFQHRYMSGGTFKLDNISKNENVICEQHILPAMTRHPWEQIEYC